MRALLAAVLTVTALGTAAPPASASRCSADIVTCTIRCIEAQLNGYIC